MATCNYVTQVDVWDVVDKGKKRIKLDGLKLAESNNGKADAAANGFDACLDAEFLDVYQGCLFRAQLITRPLLDGAYLFNNLYSENMKPSLIDRLRFRFLESLHGNVVE